MQSDIDPTVEPTSKIVPQAKSHFENLSKRLLHLFSFVPDEKLTWSPSPTAKPALQIVAHCGLTCRFFARVITGTTPETLPSPEAFLTNLHDGERNYPTRQDAIALMQEATSELCKAIETVNAQNIDAPANSVFGSFPLGFWIHKGSEQLAGHIGQLEYLQTIWGDLDNHAK